MSLTAGSVFVLVLLLIPGVCFIYRVLHSESEEHINLPELFRDDDR